mmetsp:Transcript_5162/g.11418  ORF Transcript_5162/g.11418 Transcript_5162/m.11418 type:complete len:394 (-) Transcript_5162:208-1389(-)
MSTESNTNIPVEKRWSKYNKMHVVQAGDEGFYSLVFARCQPTDTAVSVSFKLHAALWNPGPNYLSACEEALPVLFFIFFVFFAGATGVWIWLLIKGGNKVQKIHYMMAVLLVVKTMAMLFESIRYHFIATTGVGHEWSVIYYIFAFLKGLLLFTVILLIGTGWSLVKPYLNDREKKIVLVVLILQVIDNVALIVLEEMAPGSQEWYTWRDVLHLVDIICCCAILFPIVWSIRHLRQAAAADGKAAHNIMKLTLFRQFYIMVVTYIYFTRIIVFLLAATMPYDWMWLRFVFTELATLSFYVVTGYKFKPAEDNPYLKVELEDPGDFGSPPLSYHHTTALIISDDHSLRLATVNHLLPLLHLACQTSSKSSGWMRRVSSKWNKSRAGLRCNKLLS